MDRRSGAIKIAVLALLAISALAQLACIVHFGIDVPVWEHWHFIGHLNRVWAGEPWVKWTFIPFYGHLLTVSMWVLTALARLTHWNVKLEMVWGWVLMGLIGLLLARWILDLRVTAPVKLALALAAFVVGFGLRNGELTFNGFNSCVFLCYALSLGAIHLLRHKATSFGRLMAAGALGLLATASWAAGVMTWPAGALLLLDERERRGTKLAIWFSWAGFAGAVMAAGQSMSSQALGQTSPAKSKFVGWFVALLGSPFTIQSRWIPGTLFAALGLVTAVGLIRLRLRSTQWPEELRPWLALAVLSSLAVMGILLGRSGVGGFSPAFSRYAFVTSFLVTAVLALGAAVLQGQRMTRAASVTSIVLALAVSVGSATASWRTFVMMRGWHVVRGSLDRFLAADADLATVGQFLGAAQTEAPLVEEGLPILRRWHLGPFRHLKEYRSNQALLADATSKPPASVDFEFIQANEAPGWRELYGWAWDEVAKGPVRYVLLVRDGKVVEQALLGMEAWKGPHATPGNGLAWKINIPADRSAPLQDWSFVAVTQEGRARAFPYPPPVAQAPPARR